MSNSEYQNCLETMLKMAGPYSDEYRRYSLMLELYKYLDENQEYCNDFLGVITSVLSDFKNKCVKMQNKKSVFGNKSSITS